MKEACGLFRDRPYVRVQWIRAHDGSEWNEYVDTLATAAMAAGPRSDPSH